jgi:hypothetical protein
MGVDITKPAFNLERKYTVTMLTREEWIRGPAIPVVNGLIWFTDGSRTIEGMGAGVYGKSLGRKLRISLENMLVLVEVYASLASGYEIQMNNRLQKYVSICSDSQAVLKAIHTANTMSAVVRQCQKPLNISAQHTVALYWVPGHAGVCRNEITDRLAKNGSVQKSVRPELSLGSPHRKMIKRWVDNQHLAMWCGPSRTHRQAQKLISDPSLTTNTRLLTLNRSQSRVIIGLLTGHNTLRRHFYLIGLNNNPSWRRCGTEEETSVYILCECEA